MAYVGIIIPRAYRVSLHKKMRMKVSRFIAGVQVCNSGALFRNHGLQLIMLVRDIKPSPCRWRTPSTAWAVTRTAWR